MISKESSDLLREKRFGAWALTFLAFWTLFLVFYLAETTSYYRRDYPESATSLAEPAFAFYGIAFAVLALFTLCDGVTKERESGMLPVVGAKPIVRWHIPMAKLLSGLVVYAATFVVSLLPLGVLAFALGWPVIEMMALFYVGPLFALFVFLLGLGLLLGVAFNSSKVAIGTGAAILLPLFLLMPNGPMQLLYQAYPALGRLAEFTPFEATHAGINVIARGGQMPWTGFAVTIGLGLAFTVLAFWIFSRQEVAA